MSQRALVTGGTRGIGRAIATLLAQAGYEVVITGTSPEGSAAAPGRYMACDFSDMEAVQQLAARVAGLEIAVLVNNAGVNKVGRLTEYDPADFLRLQQINVTAPFLLCRALVPGMQQRRYGRIVNITSIFGVVSKAGRSAYSASKAGLAGFSRALALEVAADEVLVNCVAPGFVETEMTRENLGESGIAETLPLIPMRRLAQPDEIARVVRFLVSEENTYLTGQTIVVDGGYTCG